MTLPHPSVIPDGADVLHNTSMLQMIPSLTDRNIAEFFSTLEWVISLGNWSKPQMLVIAKLKLEGRVRQFFEASLATVSDINFAMIFIWDAFFKCKNLITHCTSIADYVTANDTIF
ncbi:hypothetical protein AVEN_23068-1 [Araneus ventricosus]|uniref:Uncharacterized protein n=1 Tax=Araneus ventricosus TaxID=182803 RepID=A0A4Y2IPA1_ARAVE|nr:hypothetical protein AVEN_23068-1 [Araneus ventricosus]